MIKSGIDISPLGERSQNREYNSIDPVIKIEICLDDIY